MNDGVPPSHLEQPVERRDASDTHQAVRRVRMHHCCFRPTCRRALILSRHARTSVPYRFDPSCSRGSRENRNRHSATSLRFALSFAKTPQSESRECNNVTNLSQAIHFKRILNSGERTASAIGKGQGHERRQRKSAGRTRISSPSGNRPRHPHP
jgi:hypothetical protein